MAVNYKPYPYTQEASDKFLKADGTWGDNNELISTIEENELVTAAALTDLDSRINSVEDFSHHCESLTWIELKEKRDNYDLIPGRYYRITDYVTTTAQENTQSAEHPFDIIVLALSDNTLSETAYAALNEDDEYFGEAGAKLDAWELKYCLDNDTSRFAWASGVSYDLVTYSTQKDDHLIGVEYNSDVSDPNAVLFNVGGEQCELRLLKGDGYTKGIGIDENSREQIDSYDWFVYIGTLEYEGSTRYVWRKNHEQGDGSQGPEETCDGNDCSYIYIMTDELYDEGDLTKNDYVPLVNVTVALGDLDNAPSETGKGVIYYMKDEWGNECPYDFKNIQFKRKITDGSLDTQSGTDTWLYTFTWFDDNYVMADASIVGQNITDGDDTVQGVHNNSILPNLIGGNSETPKLTLVLNDNVFISKYHYASGHSYYGFYGITGNKFGTNSRNNTFGNNIHNNTFGNEFSENVFGDDINNNIFDNLSKNNIFGDNIGCNKFGTMFRHNTVGNIMTKNVFGEDCYNNTFGNGFTENTLGCHIENNTFMSDVGENTFGNYFTYNTIGSRVYNNIFGNAIYYVTTGNSLLRSFFESGVSYVTIDKNYVSYLKVETGNSHVILTSTQTPTDSTQLRNITIAQGVNNTSTNKTISHNTLNDTFRTVYQPVNSVTVSV